MIKLLKLINIALQLKPTSSYHYILVVKHDLGVLISFCNEFYFYLSSKKKDYNHESFYYNRL
jgi:hypothetical protein